MNSVKPVLIVSCTDSKQMATMPAIELYTGDVFKVLRANCPNITDQFEVLILSGRHGLISADKPIAPYNKTIPKITDKNDFSAYVEQHKESAYKQLLALANDDKRPLYVVLPNAYKDVFKAVFASQKGEKLLKRFCVYMCEGHRGNKQQSARLKRIVLNANQRDTAPQPVHYRSGCANTTEVIGYQAAHQAIGTSLYYFPVELHSTLYQYTLNAIKSGVPTFVDNGMISAAKQGKFIDTEQVFSQYRKLVTEAKKHSTNISVVIPDHPTDKDLALSIVRKHKKDIVWLAKRCRVILPVHKAGTIAQQKEHCLNMLGAIDYAPVALGVPTREFIEIGGGDKVPLRLTLAEIEAMLELKHPTNDSTLIKDVHYLGMSEKTKGNNYIERLQLAQIYRVNVTFDACRTAAVFGAEETSSREGAVALRCVSEEMRVASAANSAAYNEINYETECDDSLIWTKLIELLNESVSQFLELWNSCVHYNYQISVDGLDEDEAYEYIDEYIMSFPAALENDIIGWVKPKFVRDFVTHEHTPAPQDKRTAAIVRVFNSQQAAQPVQMVMNL